MKFCQKKKKKERKKKKEKKRRKKKNFAGISQKLSGNGKKVDTPKRLRKAEKINLFERLEKAKRLGKD